MIAYVVPGKPVGVNRGGATGTRMWGKTPEQKAFATRLAAFGINARRRERWETTDAPVYVAIRVVFENEQPDTDSPTKPILDSLEVSRPRLHRPGAALLANDHQVRLYAVGRGVDLENPRVELAVFLASETALFLGEVERLLALDADARMGGRAA